jgi:hypothetical protein
MTTFQPIEQLNSVERENYFDNPNECPFCHTQDIEAHPSNADGDRVYQMVECHNQKCKARWMDEYKLDNIVIQKLPKEPEETPVRTCANHIYIEIGNVGEGKTLMGIQVWLKVTDLPSILIDKSGPLLHTKETEIEAFISHWQERARENGWKVTTTVDTSCYYD